MTPAEQRAIIAKESAWLNENFGQLDLTAFPALNELPPEQTRDDGRFAKDWRDAALSTSPRALRQFVSDPDGEARERVGAETNNEGFRDEVRQRKGETIAQQFKRANPSYIPTQNNYQTIAATLSFNTLSAAQQEGTIDERVADMIDGGFWTVANLTSCFHALIKEGLLDVPLGSVRNLSTAERLQVTRLAQSGRVDQAIGEHMKCALDGEEPGMEILNDPNYRQACDNAVWGVSGHYLRLRSQRRTRRVHAEALRRSARHFVAPYVIDLGVIGPSLCLAGGWLGALPFPRYASPSSPGQRRSRCP
jgi:hypothetical protein